MYLGDARSIRAAGSCSPTTQEQAANRERERRAPCADPDASDDRIRALGERLDILLNLRKDFKDEMAKPY